VPWKENIVPKEDLGKELEKDTLENRIEEKTLVPKNEETIVNFSTTPLPRNESNKKFPWKEKKEIYHLMSI
jgi:hypothetical protein